MDGDSHYISDTILDHNRFSGFIDTMGLNDAFVKDLILINRIYIKKAYRGQMIEKRLINPLIRSFCYGGGLLLLKAKPLQLINKDKENKSFKDFEKYNDKKAVSSLYKYYKKIGFNKIKGENIFYQYIEQNHNYCSVYADKETKKPRVDLQFLIPACFPKQFKS